jgi:hypothetical protein
MLAFPVLAANTVVALAVRPRVKKIVSAAGTVAPLTIKSVAEAEAA